MLQSKNVVSVKGGCIDGLDWNTAVHIWAKMAMVPIPEGSETHSEESGYTHYGANPDELDQPTDLRGSGGWDSSAPPSEAGGGAGDSVDGKDKVSGACELSGDAFPTPAPLR